MAGLVRGALQLTAAASNPTSTARLEDLLNLATDAARKAPDLELTLEICDWIKNKHNGPAYAAEALFKRIHGRNQQTSLLALNVLDAAVKNCGVPFHLHIASKRFLNELVRFFPEKMPTPKPPVMERILELIQLWNFGLVPKSRHKSDLTNISNMYRLLKNKGYTFPKYKESEAALIISDPALLTEQELEKEDQAAQAAKLDELLRRGTPEDLLAANELMKVLAGYDPETKPDYKKQVDEQLKKIEQSCQELLDVLGGIVPGEPLDSFKLLDELASTCRSSQPKIQGFIADEEDEKRTEVLLQLNDRINSALQGYECLRAARPMPPEVVAVIHSTFAPISSRSAAPSAARQPQNGSGSLGPAAQHYQQQLQQASPHASQPPPPPPQQQQQQGAVSLIDLDLDFGAPAAPAAASSVSGSLASDLAGLSLQPAAFAASGGYSAAPPPYAAAFTQPTPMPAVQPFAAFAPLTGAPMGFSQTLAPAPVPAPVPAPAAFAPVPAPAPAPTTAPVAAAPALQPFAAFPPPPSAAVAAPPSPVHVASPPTVVASPPAAQLVNLTVSVSPPPAATPVRPPAASTLVHEVVAHESDALKIVLELEKVDDRVNCKASVHNKLLTGITNFNLQLAVPKTQKLRLEPLSTPNIAPSSMGGRPATQVIVVENPTRAPVRIRFKLSYDIPGKQANVSEQGEFLNLPAFFG